MPEPADISYRDAVAELEQILEEIESDVVDIDLLAARVRRAAELVEVCRSRILAAEAEVVQIVADLSDESASGDQGP